MAYDVTDVVGSFVVYDPTGRDLHSCMEVGRVTRVYWDPDNDDGDVSENVRPIFEVLPNGATLDDERVAVTRVRSIVR